MPCFSMALTGAGSSSAWARMGSIASSNVRLIIIFSFNIKAKRVLMMMPIADIGKSWRARIALSMLG